MGRFLCNIFNKMKRRKGELANEVILWQPLYIHQLKKDPGLKTDDLKRAMEDRDSWRAKTDEVRASTT